MNSEIQAIIKRNKKVETDKAWETSLTRRAIVAIITYLLIVILLLIIDAPYPWINALIPTVAFILSTLTLPLFKKFWLNYIHKK